MTMQAIVDTAKRALGRLTGDAEDAVQAELMDSSTWPRRETAWAATDVIERREETILRLDVPGATRRSTDITVSDGKLEVLARREDEGGLQARDWYRWFLLSKAVDTDEIRADLSDGVLTVRLPKREAARPRKVRIRRPWHS